MKQNQTSTGTWKKYKYMKHVQVHETGTITWYKYMYKPEHKLKTFYFNELDKKHNFQLFGTLINQSINQWLNYTHET